MQYCQCTVCQQSPAKPQGTHNIGIEKIEGAQVTSTTAIGLIVHWSKGEFDRLTSVEFARLETENREVVGISALLYRNKEAALAATQPKALRNLSGGGDWKKYILEVAPLTYYLKKAGTEPQTDHNSSEVFIPIGCGGGLTVGKNISYRPVTGIDVNQGSVPVKGIKATRI